MIRKPAVAGQFYPGSYTELVSQLKNFIKPDVKKKKVIGAMVPHAGYMYSGKVAGAVYSIIEPVELYIILAVNHRGIGSRVGIMSSGKWLTPLGEAIIDSEVAQKLLEQSSLIKDDPSSHNWEHSLEVQIPFIQFTNKNFTFVPISLKTLGIQECLELAEDIAKVLKSIDKSFVILASSDMTHFESQESAKKKDFLAIDAILKLDPVGLYQTVYNYNISMCGVIPTTVMLQSAKLLGAKKAQLVDYATSGDITGIYYEVVGYAGVIVY